MPNFFFWGWGGVGRGDIPKTRVVWHCIINLLSSKDSRIAKKRIAKKRKEKRPLLFFLRKKPIKKNPL
jgi:hypothetical protein